MRLLTILALLTLSACGEDEPETVNGRCLLPGTYCNAETGILTNCGGAYFVWYHSCHDICGESGSYFRGCRELEEKNADGWDVECVCDDAAPD